MDVHVIREIIRTALDHEAQTNALRQRLEQDLPTLCKTLTLPEEEPLAALMSIITRYVNSVPSCLSLVNAVTKRLGFFERVRNAYLERAAAHPGRFAVIDARPDVERVWEQIESVLESRLAS